MKEEDGHFEERRKSSYRDKVMGLDSDMDMEGSDLDLDDDASDDDEWVDDDEGPWFSMGMTEEEKKEAKEIRTFEPDYQIGWTKHWVPIPFA